MTPTTTTPCLHHKKLGDGEVGDWGFAEIPDNAGERHPCLILCLGHEDELIQILTIALDGRRVQIEAWEDETWPVAFLVGEVDVHLPVTQFLGASEAPKLDDGDVAITVDRYGANLVAYKGAPKAKPKLCRFGLESKVLRDEPGSRSLWWAGGVIRYRTGSDDDWMELVRIGNAQSEVT